MVIREIMSGFLAPGVWDPNRGFRKGRLEGIELVDHFEISIDDLDRFLDDQEPRCDPLLLAFGWYSRR